MQNASSGRKIGLGILKGYNRICRTRKKVGKKMSNWQKARLKRLEIDNWTCQKCGADLRKVPADVHHINSKENNSLNDLMSFCCLCHPPERGEAFYEWLKKGKSFEEMLYDKLRETMTEKEIKLGLLGFLKGGENR